MSNDEFRTKAVNALVDIQNIHEHSSALVYAKDSESITFHLYWMKFYLERFQESLRVLDDVEF